MPFPWLTIVNLLPSILKLSRELLDNATTSRAAVKDIDSRVRELDEARRRHAELMSSMAQQIDVLTRAVGALRAELTIAWLALGVTAAGTAIALYIALRA